MYRSLFSRHIVSIFMVLCCMVVLSCKKVDNTPNPKISSAPEISLKKVSATTVNQFTDSLVFTIHYTDGDGNLGDEDANVHSVIVTDNRFPLDFTYHLKPLSPSNTAVIISGDLPIVLPNTILKDQNNAQETATFSIKIKDRAGNWSNTVTTGNITILK